MAPTPAAPAPATVAPTPAAPAPATVAPLVGEATKIATPPKPPATAPDPTQLGVATVTQQGISNVQTFTTNSDITTTLANGETFTLKEGSTLTQTGGKLVARTPDGQTISNLQGLDTSEALAGNQITYTGTGDHFFSAKNAEGVKEYFKVGEGDASPVKMGEGEWLTAQGKALSTGSGIGDWLANKGGFGLGSANFFGHLVEGAMWGAAAGGIVSMIAGMMGPENSNIGSASFMAVFAGTTVGKGIYGLTKAGGWAEGALGQNAGMWSAGIGLAVGIGIFLLMYKETRQEIVEFTCYAWDAPTGGNNCEDCNEMADRYGVPCSEYQCRALGQSCELQNVGTGEEMCAWVNPHDVEYPTIEPWEGALLEDYVYTPDKTISPPDRGVQVIYDLSTSGKIRPFTPLTFGVLLNEPGACKIDMLRKGKFEDMSHFFGGSSTLKYNHTEILSLPGPSAAKAANLTIYNGGKYELYVRCRDANGNENPANFVFTFEVEDGPDTTPPLIVATSTINGAPIAYNLTEHRVSAYTNEPADCKWSRLDKDYDDMEETMSCAGGPRDINSKMLYECKAILDGLKNNQANDYYLRCKDRAEVPNENKESYKFTLLGTRPLVLNEFLPEDGDLVKDASDPVKVTLEATTSAGYKDGEAICYYSTTGDQADELEFFETHSHLHKQELWLAEGTYDYNIRCIDLGGNAVANDTNFEVESDSEPPMIVRIYHEDSYLKLITDEEADCVYSTDNCDYNFDEGMVMTTIEEVNHYTDWDTSKNFFIKCMDKNGRGPEPNNVCSITARPSDMVE